MAGSDWPPNWPIWEHSGAYPDWSPWLKIGLVLFPAPFGMDSFQTGCFRPGTPPTEQFLSVHAFQTVDGKRYVSFRLL